MPGRANTTAASMCFDHVLGLRHKRDHPSFQQARRMHVPRTLVTFADASRKQSRDRGENKRGTWYPRKSVEL